MTKKEVIFQNITECTVCHSKEFIDKMKVKDFDSSLGTFKILKCKNCGMYLTESVPTEETIHFLYEDRDSNNFDNGNSSFFEILKDYFAEKELKKYSDKIKLKPKKIVDFGTGNGRYARAMKNVFPSSQITAVDFNTNAPAKIKNTVIDYMTVDEFYNSQEKYDVIFLRHVLEHSYNPIKFIEQFEKHLNEDGVLVIEVPNVDCGISNLFGRFSASYYVPYHIHHFNVENTKNMFNSLNLKYNLFKMEMPFMSNNFANFFDKPLDNKFRLLGAISHPLQLMVNIATQSSSVISAVVSFNKCL